MNHHLKVVALGLSFGLTWGLSMLLLGLLATYYSWGNPIVELCGSLYVGYQATLQGSLIGGTYGLVDGFIGGAFIAFFYNLFAGH